MKDNGLEGSRWPLRGRLLAAGLLLLPAFLIVGHSRPRSTSPVDSSRNKLASRPEILAAYGKLPLTFERNVGQSDPRVEFLAHASAYTLFLTGEGAVLRLDAPSNEKIMVPSGSSQRTRLVQSAKRRDAVVRLDLANSNSQARVEGLGMQSGRSNYFIGNDPSRWRRNVPQFARVKYRNVYPGIDAIYYGNQNRLETDYVVAPGSNPGQIAINVQGARTLKLDSDGNMVLATAAGQLVLRRPNVYQEMDGVRHEIAANYVGRGKNSIGFHLGAYDARQPLIIDPVLVYSTFIGGTGGQGSFGIAVDSSGNAYITGNTNATDFPTTAGAYQTVFTTSPTNLSVAFVTKINPAGTALVYSTFLGGSASGGGSGIAVDPSEDAFVAGSTIASDFPLTTNAYQTSAPNGGVFVTELDPTGSLLLYSTYLAGVSGAEGADSLAIALNPNDGTYNAYILGRTSDTNFPITPNAFQNTNNTSQTNPDKGTAFLSRIDPSLVGTTSLVYSTYLGGSSTEFPLGVAADSNENAYITGSTTSSDFPVTAGAYMSTLSNQYGDVFISRIDTTLSGQSSLVYSTYFGGKSDSSVYGGDSYDIGSGIAAQPNSVAVVVGYSYALSGDFPLTSNALETTSNSPNAIAFLARFDTTKSGTSSLLYSSYWGGTKSDLAFGTTLDAADNIYMAGTTSDTNFPTTPGAPLASRPGIQSAFVSEFDPTGATALFSTYWGSGTPNADAAQAVAVDSATPANVYITGETQDSNFPTTAGAYQTTFKGTGDVYVTKMSPGAAASVFASPTSLSFGNQGIGVPSASKTVTLINNTSNTLSNIAITFTGANPADFSETTTCPVPPATLAAHSNCAINVIFTPSISGAESATLNIADSDASSPQTVALTGTGTAISVTPTTLPFGNQTQSTSSAPQVVTVTNNGTAALTITSISITGANAGDFAQTNTCPISPSTLAGGGGNCTISVVFTPTTQTAESATLQIADSDPSSPQLVTLSGTGTKPVSGVTVTPTSLSFGNQPEGTASVAKNVTLSNSGTAQLTGITLSFTGANAADFSETDTCASPGGTLASGKSCTISVTFTPSTQAAESANLNIADSDPTSPQIVPLTGTGSAPTTAFLVTLSPTSTTITAGQTFPVNVTVTSENSFSAAVTLACVGTPGDSSCTASPNPVTPAANGTAPSVVTIVTDLQPASTFPSLPFPFRPHHPLWVWSLGGLAMALLALWSVRRRGAKRLACGFAMVLLLGLACCAGKPTTPPGTYQIQIKGISGSQTFPATFTLTVK